MKRATVYVAEGVWQVQRLGVNKDLQVAGAAAAEQTGKRGRGEAAQGCGVLLRCWLSL